MGLSQKRRPRRSVLSNLLAPINTDKVLIPDEKIIYNERLHWASLLRSLVETIAALLLVTAISGGAESSVGAGNSGGGGTSAILLAVLVLFGLGLVFYRIRKGDLSRIRAIAWAVGLLIGFAVLGTFLLAFLTIALVVGRFWSKVLFWLLYERLFITNRRIILATGFLGSEINTMPLTRVTDISYKTTILSDILGFGILRVESAGQDQALSDISFLDKPDEFYDTLIHRTTAAVGSVTEDSRDLEENANKDEDDGSGTRSP